MNAIDLIIQDHREVDNMYEQFQRSQDSEQKRDLVNQMIHELSVHAAVEEEIFYPMVRNELPQGDSLADEALHEHGEIKQILHDLDGMDTDDSGLDAMVGNLIQEVRHHVEEEETDILPPIRERLDGQRLEEIGDELEQAKGRAPTRPHPNAPDTPPGNKILGPAAAIVDRVRDRAQDRPT